MNKEKAIVSAMLLLIVIAIALTGARFVNNEELGINLHDLILIGMGYIWIANRIGDFYRWIMEED